MIAALLRSGTLLWLAICIPLNTFAATFSVNPVFFTLSPKRVATSMQIVNQDSVTIRLQIQAVTWTIDDNEERLEPTEEVLLNPPFIKLEPGQGQIVRFGLRKPVQSDREKAYRLIIEEIPDSSVPVQGVRTVLRISVPVFVEAGTPQQDLAWTAHVKEKTVEVNVVNRGTVHAKLLKVDASPGDCGVAGPPALTVGPFYLLPGQNRKWSLPQGGFPGQKGCLNVSTEAGRHEVPITVQVN